MSWRSALSLIPLSLVLSCAGEEPIDSDEDPTPRCDGRQQADEADVDAPFDLDGDGFFDANDPGCQEAWTASQLDCDDSDPAVNPTAFELPCNGKDDDCRAASEDDPDNDGDGVGACTDCQDSVANVYPGAVDVCFDGLDNDCDGTNDNGCGEDYNGTWALDAPVTFGCSLLGVPLIDVDFQEVVVIWNPPYLAIGPSSPPGTLDGEVALDGTFIATKVASGDCVENYTFDGVFTSASTFEGAFVIDLESATPIINTCLGCPLMPQSFPVSGTKL